MEKPEEMIASSSTNCEDKSSKTASTPTTSESISPGLEEESQGCRKSSRLKAKMNRQCQPGNEEAGDTYKLRLSSLVKRVQVERRQSTPKQPKGKSMPPPLSKYRRRTANARERMRMKDINEGFERLHQSLPEMEQLKSQGKKKENPTKLTILNLALNYIHALRDVLGYPSMNDDNRSGIESGNSKESDLGSDASSTRTLSTSSGSPDSSVLDLKEFSLSEAPFVSSEIPKDLTSCHHTAPSSIMEFRGEARSSPSSSDLSLSPTPPPLPLPEECMDIDHSDLLDVSISLAEWDGIEDIIL